MCTVLLPPDVNPIAVNKYITISISSVHAMKAYGEVGAEIPSFLTSAFDAGDKPASRLRHFASGKKVPGFYR
jgi:hypothetical protein